MFIKEGFFLLFSYLFASVPFGLVICLLFYKKDIRLEGSKNIGATNAFRICGRKAGLLTFLLDGSKGFIPVLIAKNIFVEGMVYIVAVTAIFGHIFPIYLKFKGGKGIATSLFAVIAANPTLGICGALIWITSFALFGFSSLSSILMCILTIPVSCFIAIKSASFEILIFNIVFSTVVLIKHKENILRLLQRKEPKTISKSLF